MTKPDHDEGYAKGYQAALDDVENSIIGQYHNADKLSGFTWIIDKIQELKDRQKERE